MDVEAWSTGGSRVIALGDGPRGREPLTRQQKSNFDPIFQSNLLGGVSAKKRTHFGQKNTQNQKNQKHYKVTIVF